MARFKPKPNVKKMQRSKRNDRCSEAWRRLREIDFEVVTASCCLHVWLLLNMVLREYAQLVQPSATSDAKRLGEPQRCFEVDAIAVFRAVEGRRAKQPLRSTR
jgi:hypothetical protein